MVGRSKQVRVSSEFYAKLMQEQEGLRKQIGFKPDMTDVTKSYLKKLEALDQNIILQNSKKRTKRRYRFEIDFRI